MRRKWDCGAGGRGRNGAWRCRWHDSRRVGWLRRGGRSRRLGRDRGRWKWRHRGHRGRWNRRHGGNGRGHRRVSGDRDEVFGGWLADVFERAMGLGSSVRDTSDLFGRGQVSKVFVHRGPRLRRGRQRLRHSLEARRMRARRARLFLRGVVVALYERHVQRGTRPGCVLHERLHDRSDTVPVQHKFTDVQRRDKWLQGAGQLGVFDRAGL